MKTARALSIAFFLSLLSVSLCLSDTRLDEVRKKLREAGVPLMQEEWKLPVVPDSQNAAFAYKEAYELIVTDCNAACCTLTEVRRLKKYFPVTGLTPWQDVPPAVKKEVSQLILTHQDFVGMYQLLERASEMPCVFRENGTWKLLPAFCDWGKMGELQVSSAVRTVVYAAGNKMVAEAEFGSPEKAVSACLMGMRMARALGNEPTNLAPTTRMVAVARIVAAMRDILGKIPPEKLPAETVLPLIDALRQERNEHPAFENLKAYATMESVYRFAQFRKQGEGAFVFTDEDRECIARDLPEELRALTEETERKNKEFLREAWKASGIPSAQEFFDAVETYVLEQFAACAPYTCQPFWTARPHLEEVVRQAEQTAAEKQFLRGFVYANGLSRFCEREARYDASLGIAELVLACRAYRHRHGRYPSSLEALVPDYLFEMPVDPFTGKPFVYQRRFAGFAVISVGENLTNDGGREEWNGRPDIVWRFSR